MNLTKLFEIQKVLDAAINKKKGLDERDLLSEKILALQVELGECANEWRGFKFWSNNQNPCRTIHTTEGATEKNAIEFSCSDEDCGQRFNKSDARLQDLFGENNEDCPVCRNGFLYAFRTKNPLLEEYVDCLHFILSIGLERKETTMTTPYDESWITKTITVTGQFSQLFDEISNFSRYKTVSDYASVLDTFIGLGEMLGFTWDQIESAYMEKNATNHDRQENGY
ncbi:dUTP diphosphatase [Sporosarcina sp. E16_8]|uniref:dUTP diphosphatase n=1 Tax=Sporosarcina sp. E16_8 TaxID=2789295 RepID=UPI001A92C415|nr:dUTP diphosphatase [Sporosarcina sp. E16_8]MBO0586136.1 dUTP diphosphatase [Sporosarcina sp. E16_8]